ncbi:MAG TPA: nucleoside deaminase [Agromyces sp.]|jgi:tRNA(Arg) A34 adenosine deaminase TadA
MTTRIEMRNGGDVDDATDVTRADLEWLAQCILLAGSARDRGDHPFGSIVVTDDGRTVEGLNTVVTGNDPTGHAETNVVRLAAQQLSPDELATSTLYTSTEPCAMCAGAIYWSGIGRVVFALSEQGLAAIVADQEGVPTMHLPCREVFARGGRRVVVAGPVELPAAVDVHEGFWI